MKNNSLRSRILWCSFRSVTYHCNDTTLVTDDGKYIEVFCKDDTTWDAPGTWPECRYPANCVDLTPLPPLETGLADSTSTVAKEGDEAVYQCTDSPTFLVNGVDTDFKYVGFLNYSHTERSTILKKVHLDCSTLIDDISKGKKRFKASSRFPLSVWKLFSTKIQPMKIWSSMAELEKGVTRLKML